ncbi:unnamed protein product, partial [Polarella glacialis]
DVCNSQLGGPQEVADWLVSLGVEEKAVSKFVEQEIDGNALLEVTDEELKNDLEVEKFGQRKRILTLREKLKSCRSPPVPQGVPRQLP